MHIPTSATIPKSCRPKFASEATLKTSPKDSNDLLMLPKALLTCTKSKTQTSLSMSIYQRSKSDEDKKRLWDLLLSLLHWNHRAPQERRVKKAARLLKDCVRTLSDVSLLAPINSTRIALLLEKHPQNLASCLPHFGKSSGNWQALKKYRQG